MSFSYPRPAQSRVQQANRIWLGCQRSSCFLCPGTNFLEERPLHCKTSGPCSGGFPLIRHFVGNLEALCWSSPDSDTGTARENGCHVYLSFGEQSRNADLANRHGPQNPNASYFLAVIVFHLVERTTYGGICPKLGSRGCKLGVANMPHRVQLTFILTLQFGSGLH